MKPENIIKKDQSAEKNMLTKMNDPEDGRWQRGRWEWSPGLPVPSWNT